MVPQASRLQNVRYDIRGPVLRRARQLEAQGHQILKLNLGNPAPFGLAAADAVIHDVVENIGDAQGYSDARGIHPARLAVAQFYTHRGVAGLSPDDVFIGNGVSELIVMALQALLDNGDEVLIPSPDYPLWTGAVSLCGGRAVHYRCDEEAGWAPDLEHVAAQITDRTRALVIINPNNPTGAVYARPVLDGLLDLARQAQPAGPVRRDLRPDPLRRRDPRARRRAGSRPHGPHSRRPVQDLPPGRVPVRLAGDLRAHPGLAGLPGGPGTAGQHAAVRRTSRRSTRSRPRSAATRASRACCCPAAASASSATAPGSR